MDKNTIWAIVLSALVLIGFMVFQTMSYIPTATEAYSEDLVATTNQPAPVVIINENTEFSDGISATDGIEVEESLLIEEFYTISTKSANIRLTNRGGDIVGYELKEHRDGDYGVEMTENITPTNRAFSLAFGSATNEIINDLFTMEIIDDYTIGFSKEFSVTNSSGGVDRFILKKLYEFDPEEYLFKLDIKIDGKGDMRGLAFDDVAYTLKGTPQIGPYYDPTLDRYENRTFIFFTDNKLKKKTLGQDQIKNYDEGFSWAGVSGKYFTEQILPATETTIKNATYSTLGQVDGFQNAQIMLERSPITQQSIQDTYYIYMGPKVDDTLVIYNNSADNNWGLGGFRLDESLGSGWLSWLEVVLNWIMKMFYKIIPNWGVSIILMTILLKVVMYPLTKKSSMSTLKMQEVQPRMKELQEKYKGSPEKLNGEMAKLYKETGYNPLSGCLPLLIQFPLILAMFGLFNNYFEFRGAMFIPGWIPDLSVSDRVGIFPAGIPFVGGMPISILPVIYVGSQLLFTKITQSTAAASGNKSMKIMLYAMPLIFFFMFYTAPAGLLLYWTVSNFLQLVQQLAINKMMHAKRKEMGIADKDSVKRTLPPSAKKKK